MQVRKDTSFLWGALATLMLCLDVKDPPGMAVPGLCWALTKAEDSGMLLEFPGFCETNKEDCYLSEAIYWIYIGLSCPDTQSTFTVMSAWRHAKHPLHSLKILCISKAITERHAERKYNKLNNNEMEYAKGHLYMSSEIV